MYWATEVAACMLCTHVLRRCIFCCFALHGHWHSASRRDPEATLKFWIHVRFAIGPLRRTAVAAGF